MSKTKVNRKKYLYNKISLKSSKGKEPVKLKNRILTAMILNEGMKQRMA